MKKLLFLAAFAFLNVTTQSQIIDSIKLALKHKPTLSFRFDNRHSFVSTTKSKINAYKIGLEFNDKFRTGIGYNNLISSISRKEIIRIDGFPIDTVTSHLKLWYIGTYAEYVFFKNNRWEFSIPIQLGMGGSRFDYEYDLIKSKVLKKFIVNYEANITGHYKLFTGLGLGAGIGYQLMLIDNPAINENFNTPVYSFKIKLFLGEIYRKLVII